MTLLGLSLLEDRHPDENPLLASCLVIPSILLDVINRRSTLVAAPAGYGKTTLAYLARAATTTWFHVVLSNDDLDADRIIDSLMSTMTKQLWRSLGDRPEQFERLGRRAEAVKYFLQQYVGMEIDYWLETLAEDHPEQAGLLQGLARLQTRQLFTETADDELRVSILLDCIVRLGYDGVGIWLDLHEELEELPDNLRDSLAYIYDFLALLRNRSLFIKCLATPPTIGFLESRRGPQTLSTDRLTLDWSQERLALLIDRRLEVASRGRVLRLDDLIESARFRTFLRDYADLHSPAAWVNLARQLAQQINLSGTMPATGTDWLAARRAYCAEHLKIRRDREGRFWRGNQLLEGLVPRKRAIYPLIDHLYENPGFHRTYQFTRQLYVDENILNKTISRARKEHIEPQLDAGGAEESGFIYLVTDHKGGGYGLQHTDRSP